MPIRLFHPDNGFHNVYSETAADEHAKHGWVRYVEQPAKSVIEDAPTNAVKVPTAQRNNKKKS